MHLGRNNPAANYNMMSSDQQNYLETSKEEKDLGVWVDDDLIFDSHVDHVVARSDHILGLIKRSVVCRDANQLFRGIGKTTSRISLCCVA